MAVRSSLLDLHDLFPFASPNVPDLGCFVRHKHDLETYDFFVWGEPAPWTTAGIIPHQTYIRVLCGEAAFYQRARLVMLGGTSSMFDAVFATPDFVLGGDFRPQPSEWVRFPTQTVNRMYWVVGEHRDPATTSWVRDAVVGHSFDIYENGTLSTVHFDDTGADRDMNDLILEVAVVHRRWWAVFDPGRVAEAEVRQFDSKQFPKIRKAMRTDRRVEETAAAE